MNKLCWSFLKNGCLKDTKTLILIIWNSCNGTFTSQIFNFVVPIYWLCCSMARKFFWSFYIMSCLVFHFVPIPKLHCGQKSHSQSVLSVSVSPVPVRVRVRSVCQSDISPTASMSKLYSIYCDTGTWTAWLIYHGGPKRKLRNANICAKFKFRQILTDFDEPKLCFFLISER
jgi:hypothetical protein